MFERPMWLIGASVVIAVLATMAWRARRLRAARCRRLGVTPIPWKRGRVISIVAALLLLALAAAGLRWGTASVATAAGHDVVVVIDTSRSMLAKDALPDRITRGKELARDAVASLAAPAGNRVALITFAGQSRLVVPLTYDLKHVETAIAEIELSDNAPREAKSGTRIGAAVEQAVQTLSVGRGEGLVLLFSDGDDPVGDSEWLRGAEIAAEARVPVGVIGIGDATRDSAVPGRTEARTQLREGMLRDLATRTGGQYLAAANGPANVAQLTQNLLADRPRMDDPTLVTVRSAPWIAPFLTGAFVLLTLSLVGLQWRLVAAAAVVATVSAAPVDDWLQRGDVELTAGRPAQALTWYAKAEGRAQDPGLVAFNEGVALVALGRYREAELHFQWCLSDATGERRVRALYNLGTSLVRRCAGRDRAALQAAVAAFRQAQDAMNPTDDFAVRVQENLEVAKDLIAQLPAESSPTPGDGPSSDPDKPAPNTQSSPTNAGAPKPDKNTTTSNGVTPNTTDQAGPPGQGNLPPLADTDQLTTVTPADFEEHLRRVTDRVTAAKRDRLRATMVDRPVTYPDW